MQRTDLGFSVKRLAEILNLSEGTIRKLEQGEELPRAATGKKLADLYGVRVTDIWGAL